MNGLLAEGTTVGKEEVCETGWKKVDNLGRLEGRRGEGWGEFKKVNSGSDEDVGRGSASECERMDIGISEEGAGCLDLQK
jgi:hypothetical protein